MIKKEHKLGYECFSEIEYKNGVWIGHVWMKDSKGIKSYEQVESNTKGACIKAVDTIKADPFVWLKKEAVPSFDLPKPTLQ